MSNIKGTNVAAPIVPFTTDDNYATHYAQYGKGGYRTVQTIEERDSIPEARLEEGMLAYVVEDPDNIHTYQYINSTWTKSKIGSGVEKVSTITERDSLTTEEGDIVYVEETGELYTKLSDNLWKSLSIGIPIFTKQQENALQTINKLPDDYISIPDPGELDIPTETTEYESTGRGYYLDIIFSTLKALQAEVAKLRNSFTYGINSYTGKDTAMGRVVGDYELPEQEPLWDVDEADLSLVEGADVNLQDNNSLTPSENVSIGDKGYLIVNGSASWVNPEEGGFSIVEDPKLYIFLTTSDLKIKLKLSKVGEEDQYLIADLSTMELKRYESGRYNIMFCLSRTIEDNGNTYGHNYLWVSVGNYTTGGVENQGYWNSNTGKLQTGMTSLNGRYTFSSIEFTDLNLYKLNGYSKFQDLSSIVDPVIPTDDTYKYRVAHITIRSVKDESELQSIKRQLPANELIYNEQTGVLWIKTSNGDVKPISGSGSQQDDGMDKSEIKEWLEQNGIIVSDDGSTPVELNKISDITFIHQATGKKFKFEVDSEGNLISEEIPGLSLTNRMTTVDFNNKLDVKIDVQDSPNAKYGRGFVGLLGYLEKGETNVTKDLRLYSDRVKIGSIYAPYSLTQPTYGCSHAFIELENTGDRDFPLDGCYLHYATGTSRSAGQVDDIQVYHLELHGKIPAGGTYLIRGKKYSDPKQANTFINIDTFDQEWYVGSDGAQTLIDLTQNNNNTYLLTYGLSNIGISSVLVQVNPKTIEPYKDSKFPNLYHPYYIDSVSIGKHVTYSGAYTWVDSKAKFFASDCGTGTGQPKDAIFKNQFELDPAKQAFQSCNTADSSRARNASDADFQYVLLDKEYIEFPKTGEVYPVSNYTPKASWQHKNVSTDKSKLNLQKPNMVTVSFGIDIYRTRCFNWISCGYFDEFVWIREKGSSVWQARFESYKDGTGNDDPGDSGMIKKEFGTFTCKTGGTKTESIQKYVYDRITGTFPADGTNYTSHKCIVDIYQTAMLSGKTVFEYIVGRADKNNNPDPDHTSNIQEFTVYSTDYTPRIFQITDQQGFHWIEYQCWAAAAEELNKNIATISSTEQIIPILINTGDMTQNGTRINEWLDYYNGGYCLFNHLEQANVVGNNDLCNTNPEELGTGDDNGKSNGFYFHIFYCYEIDESILPIITNNNATKYVPSLYYFESSSYRFVLLNTEITVINCKDWFKQTYTTGNNTVPVNVYTGWTVPDSASVNAVFDGSFKTIYTMVKEMLTTEKKVIAACHEMPFTVVTMENLDSSTSDVDRSLTGSNSGNLVGCHCNRLNANDKVGIYWLSRLFESCGVKLCIGGHKHTYACTNPVREFYYYEEDGVTKNSLENGSMQMGNTLEDDDKVSWTTTLYKDGQTYKVSPQTGTDTLSINTTKFPIMVDPTTNTPPIGVTLSSTTIFPYYGVNSLTGGVVYFMCQATGFKLKSNKELPSTNQKFSYVIPKTNVDGSKVTPSGEQQLPMFSEIKLGENSYLIYLYRINNIMSNKGTLFSQIKYSTNPASYEWLVGNTKSSEDLPDFDKIYGKWVDEKTALIEIQNS